MNTTLVAESSRLTVASNTVKKLQPVAKTRVLLIEDNPTDYSRGLENQRLSSPVETTIYRIAAGLRHYALRSHSQLAEGFERRGFLTNG